MPRSLREPERMQHGERAVELLLRRRATRDGEVHMSERFRAGGQHSAALVGKCGRREKRSDEGDEDQPSDPIHGVPPCAIGSRAGLWAKQTMLSNAKNFCYP